MSDLDFVRSFSSGLRRVVRFTHKWTRRLSSFLHRSEGDANERCPQYRTVAEQSHDGIAIVQDGTYAFVNQRMAKIVEYDRETLTGMPFEAIIATEYRELVQNRYEQRLAGESPPSQYEIEVVTAADASKYIDLRVSRIQYEGSPATLATFRDVTDRRERDRELLRLENAVEHAGNAIFITDDDGTIEFVNDAFEAITGYSAEDAIGETPYLLASCEHDAELYADIWNTILDGDIWTGDITHERASGDRYIAQVTVAPIEGTQGELQGAVAIQDDITTRQLREQQLEVFHRILRHNLRNELSVVQGYAEVLQEAVDDGTHVERLEAIQESVRSLVETSSKAHRFRETLSQGAEDAGECSLHAFLGDETDRLSEAYPDVDLTLEIESQDTLMVDRRATIAIRELIENGCKHGTAASPSVTVTITADSTTVRVTVSDNGPGIPAQERRAIEFGGEDPLRHGSGLGLWIAHWLIYYVGGTIDFEDTTNGTTVTTRLPH